MLKKLSELETNLRIKLFGVRIAICIFSYTFYGNFGRNKILRYIVRWLLAPLALLTSRHTIPRVTMDVTTRCNLNCKGCAKSIDKFKELGMAEDYQTETLLENIDLLLPFIKNCLVFTLIGGEPLLHPELPIIIKRLTSEPKIKYVQVYTNGTIFPAVELQEALKSKKIIVHMSYYEKLSVMKQRILDFCIENGIKYTVNKNPEWQDFKEMKSYGYTFDEMKKQFLSCVCRKKGGKKLYEGKLFKCARAQAGRRLGIIPPNEEGEFYDYIDLRECGDAKEFWKKLNALYNDPNAQKSCYYCVGRLERNAKIAKAEQASLLARF